MVKRFGLRLSRMLARWVGFSPPSPPRRMNHSMRISVEAGSARRDRIIVRPRLRVQRPRLSYLEERGWVKLGDVYNGFYKTRYGRWPGTIQCRNGNMYFYIYKPPSQLRKSQHWSCFSHVGDNWWWIHFRHKCNNPSNGILGIECVIHEAYAKR